MRSLPYAEQQLAATALSEYIVQLGKALDKKNKRADIEGRLRKLRDETKMGSTFSHAKEDDKKERTPCPKCGLVYCPKGVDSSWWCDVYDKPGPNRMRSIMRHEAYRKKVDEYRKKAGMPKLIYPEEPKVNVHANADIKNFEDVSDGDEGADLDSVLAEMNARWHTDIITSCLTDEPMLKAKSEDAA